MQELEPLKAQVSRLELELRTDKERMVGQGKREDGRQRSSQLGGPRALMALRVCLRRAPYVKG